MVAGFLTYSHYFPGTIEKFIVCGGEYAGTCDALNQWEYASIFGIPIAAYGLFMFLLILFTALIADYAAGEYYVVGFMLVLPLVILSLLADIVLAGVMIWLKTFCLLCGITYFINFLLLLTIYVWYQHLTREGGSLREAYGSLLLKESDSSHKKASAALYVLFIFLLFFSVFSTSYVLQIKTYPVRQSKEQTQKAVESFYLQTPENLELPVSQLRMGPAGAKVQIVAFTDFLCSACFQFFQLEKELHAQYGEKISVTYYNYPLDQECNGNVQQTMYKSSCTASKAMLSAASLNVFTEYVVKHFSRYEEFHSQYARDKALAVADGLVNEDRFQQEIDGDAVKQIVMRDIELAEKLHIKATPTLFINGRRMEGVPSREILESIIERELKSAAAK